MPAIWSSSERPISVRMVWVDGARHTILSRDDPLLLKTRRRPRTSSSATTTTTATEDKSGYPLKFEPSFEPEVGFDGCFVKLRLAVEKTGSDERTLPWRQSVPICAREPDEIGFEESSPRLTSLSERVLQWLDLSGKSAAFDPEDEEEEERIVVPRRRYSNFKDEGTSVRIVVPSQYLIPAEKSLEDGSVAKRKTCKTSRNASLDSDKTEDERADDSREKELEEADESQSAWEPPGKPQLHIFMPSLKPTEIHWLSSSQESLFSE